jgi:hypothetical protein
MAPEQHGLTADPCCRSLERKYGHVTLLLIAVLLSGCPHLISLDYVPNNPYVGQGQVGVDRFEYLPLKRGELGPRHVEVNPQAAGRFYLSQTVPEFFAEAVKRELIHSGYQVTSSGDLEVSGQIERFYYNPVDAQEASIELIVHYVVRNQEREMYTQSVKVLRKTSKSLLAVSQLIHVATRESIHQFLTGAREAKVLK